MKDLRRATARYQRCNRVAASSGPLGAGRFGLAGGASGAGGAGGGGGEAITSRSPLKQASLDQHKHHERMQNQTEACASQSGPGSLC